MCVGFLIFNLYYIYIMRSGFKWKFEIGFCVKREVRSGGEEDRDCGK